MNEKIIKLGDALMALTTTEAVELQTYLESKGLVMIQQTPTTVQAVTVEEVTESENVNLVVITASGSKIKFAKALIPVTGKSALENANFAKVLPATILENIPRAKANSILSDLANELDPTEFQFELQDAV